MQNGDVIAFQGNAPGAKAIRVGTRSKYSHVGLVVRVIEVDVDRVFILESVTSGGVMLLPLSRKLRRYKGKAWWFPLKIENDSKKFSDTAVEEGVRTTIYKWAMGELGKEYDFKMIKSIVKSLFLKAKAPQENDEEYICSELVARAFKEVGILPRRLTTSNITPKDIARLKILGSSRSLIR